ncbi:MAG: hypothetical protein QOF72_1986, partial [Blastocatellia bacterium]|nr:hypothetical protein [Blastocatellia bacterium]
FDASGFWLFDDEQVKHIFLLEVFDAWFIHGLTFSNAAVGLI